jgi:MGT family glycosyltransferase
MARLLAYTSPAQGHVFPPVGMLLELRRRGHEIHMRTRASDVDRLAELGLRTSAVDPRIPAIEIDDWRARSQIDALRRLVRFFAARAEFEIPDLRQAIDEVRPDALIVDVNCLGASYLAETIGLPWAQYCPHPPPIRSTDVPAHGLGLAPGRGRLGRARDRVSIAFSDRIAAPMLQPLNEHRALLRLPPVRKWDEQYLESDRFILFTAEPYEYPRSDWPESVRLVGPGEWEPAAQPPAWLAAETRPIVLVTASTERQGDDKLIATALEALAGDDLAVVASTAAHDPAAFDVPPTARAERFLPHAPIIARAACVVSHGGQGTTQKALAAGVPVCVVPFCRDQFDVGRRVELAGAGVRLSHKRLNPDRLRAAVRSTMAKRPGAQRVAQSFAEAGGASAAADAVEELLPGAASMRSLAAPPAGVSR